jgi:pyruvate-formate lyase-activating enzyme
MEKKSMKSKIRELVRGNISTWSMFSDQKHQLVYDNLVLYSSNLDKLNTSLHLYKEKYDTTDEIESLIQNIRKIQPSIEFVLTNSMEIKKMVDELEYP